MEEDATACYLFMRQSLEFWLLGIIAVEQMFGVLQVCIIRYFEIIVHITCSVWAAEFTGFRV